jgi:sodium-dependent dicarboxylate transporter 2/3/5
MTAYTSRYAASLGGSATIIGTGANLVFKAVYETMFPQAPEITFFDWFLFAAPLSYFFLLLLWLGFCFAYLSELNPNIECK